MSFREEYYVHVHGEQLGPYTLRQLDHQLQTGLLSEDTLYWSEGLEQWQPVTNLIPLKQKFRPLRAALIALAVLVPLGVLALFFGPSVLDGWREQTPRYFTAEGAYWAARGIVRHELAAEGTAPQFHPFASAHIQLGAENTAVVQIEGRLLGGPRNGQPAAWKVRLRFDPAVRTWSPLPVQSPSP